MKMLDISKYDGKTIKPGMSPVMQLDRKADYRNHPGKFENGDALLEGLSKHLKP
jgi:hypothetical protein